MLSFWLISLILFGITILFLYIYLKWNFNYWKKRYVNGPKPTIICGTFPTTVTQKQNMIYDMEEIYYKYKNKENFVGVFTVRTPELLVIKPELAHEVLVTKFSKFHDNALGAWVNMEKDKMAAANPFFHFGLTWKERRAEIIPAMKTLRLKSFFPELQKTCDKMTEFISKKIQSFPQNAPLDAKNISSRYTVETITDFVFGLKAGAFDDIDCDIFNEAEKLLDPTLMSFSWFLISNVVPSYFQKLFSGRFFRKDIDIFFTKLLNKSIEEHLNSKNNRFDVVDYLLELKLKKNLTQCEIVANSLIFFLDGYETSATVISNTLLGLGRNPFAQEKLRNEINENLDENGLLSYQKLMEMTYLEQCTNEAIRLLPPCLFASRICDQSIELENMNGRKLMLEKGIVVNIPFMCFHHDAEYFPNPEEFTPERFDNGAVKNYKLKGMFIPFGDGPRICLGLKLGLLQSKLAICEIVKKFVIKVDKKTRTDTHVGPVKFITALEGGIWLNLHQI